MRKKDEVKLWIEAWSTEGYPVGDMTTEYRFHAVRLWRFDIAWPSLLIAVEIDGGGYGHQSIVGRKQDNEKQNEATFMGWRVFRYVTSMTAVKRLEAVGKVAEFMCGVES